MNEDMTVVLKFPHRATSASTNTLLITLFTHTAIGVLVQPTAQSVHVNGGGGGGGGGGTL